ncbi:plasmid stabilization protein [Trinickia dabaoshanensis]|uniref:Plasmid stabilization protein n=1 Tax=Trinickia dabaoshanensis TaxID=564714 RepID=A0A2N7W3H1_9BURK|nr:plasmid stabilization protein [Trinickia dabaoshanensis]PMS23958.1 plasmid stabilization protein [Trinickia dabaoshanensis]
MASMTIRNIDEQLKSRLRVQAAHHGRSMEDEARDILRAALSTQADAARQSLIDSIRSRMSPLGGVDLALPARETIPDRVDFGA